MIFYYHYHFSTMTRLKSGRILSCQNEDFLKKVQRKLCLVSVIVSSSYRKNHRAKVVRKKRRKFFKLRRRKKYKTYLYFSKENEIF